jgi:uncharacterized glyoxalase superfamily protein PhnB
MIGGISHSYIWVEDHGRALDFYVRLLGFEVREDRQMGDRRWVTIGRPSQPELRVVLSVIGPPLDELAAAHVRAMQAAGQIVAGGLVTTDCRADHADLAAAGVRFVVEPTEQMWGIEAVLSDDSGNAWGLVQSR